MKLYALASVAAFGALVACSASSPRTVIQDENPTDPETSSSSSGGLPVGKGSSSSSSTSASSTSSSSGSTSSGSSGKGTSTSSSSGSSGTSTSSSSGGPTGDNACGAKADYATCSTCCETNHATGANTFYGALETCLCQTSVCASACGTTLCAATPTNPSTACQTCIKQKEQTSCATPVTTACNADPDCQALDTCYGICDTAFPQ